VLLAILIAVAAFLAHASGGPAAPVGIVGVPALPDVM